MLIDTAKPTTFWERMAARVEHFFHTLEYPYEGWSLDALAYRYGQAIANYNRDSLVAEYAKHMLNDVIREFPENPVRRGPALDLEEMHLLNTLEPFLESPGERGLGSHKAQWAYRVKKNPRLIEPGTPEHLHARARLVCVRQLQAELRA